jgi:hypothetical protein
VRGRAIFCALLYGLLPSSWYEPTPHYDCGYWRHLALNLRHAARWALGREDHADRAFEAEVNARPVPMERCR